MNKVKGAGLRTEAKYKMKQVGNAVAHLSDLRASRRQMRRPHSLAI